jgi:hypothetical protein
LDITHSGTNAVTKQLTYGELIINATSQCINANCQDYVLSLDVMTPGADGQCQAQVTQIGLYKLFYSTTTSSAPTVKQVYNPGAFLSFDQMVSSLKSDYLQNYNRDRQL